MSMQHNQTEYVRPFSLFIPREDKAVEAKAPAHAKGDHAEPESTKIAPADNSEVYRPRLLEQRRRRRKRLAGRY